MYFSISDADAAAAAADAVPLLCRRQMDTYMSEHEPLSPSSPPFR